MVPSAAEAVVTAPPPRSRRGRWLAAIVVAVLAAAFLTAITSTHAALSGDTYLTSIVPVGSDSLTEPTAAEYASVFPTTEGYSRVLWANRPGGEVTAGFSLHNGGPVPITLLSVVLFYPGPPNAFHMLAPAGVQFDLATGRTTPFHPVALGSGNEVDVRLTERVICTPNTRMDARMPGADRSFYGATTSPVIVRYRVLGLTMSQTISLVEPILVMMRASACK